MQNKLTVLFATDQYYIAHLATAIYSLLKNNKNISFKIVVFSSDISILDQQKLETITTQFNSKIIFKMLDDVWFEDLILNNHFKKSNYFRLFAADLIDDDYCLYLDADLIVENNLSYIFSVNLTDQFVAAVEDPGFNRHIELEMSCDSKYFNSGVMLINLNKWREFGMRSAVINLIKTKPEVIKFVDQCGLNSIIDGRWKELDYSFNVQSSMIQLNLIPTKNLKHRYNIIHFTGTSKPWQMLNEHLYKAKYWDYRSKTPYKSCFSDDFSILNSIRYTYRSIQELYEKLLLKLEKGRKNAKL